MRIRTIKPDFWLSESVGRLSREARLLFIGLWSFADDAGRGRGALPPIAGALFPYDRDAPDRIASWMGELERERMVRRYTAEDGNTYYEIPKWVKHQRVDRPTPSRIPPPETTVAEAQPATGHPALAASRAERPVEIEALQRVPHRTPAPPPENPPSPPPSFPRTVDEAIAGAAGWQVTEAVAERAWILAASRGWRDSRDVPIRSWSHYVAHCEARNRQRAPQRTMMARSLQSSSSSQPRHHLPEDDVELPIFFNPPPYDPIKHGAFHV